MLQTFTEALAAIPSPCSRALVVVSIVAVLAARHHTYALAGVVGAAIVGGWNLAAGWFVLDRSQNWIAYLVALVSLIAIVVWRRNRWVASAGAAGAVFAASLWWIPCVGRKFGAMLNDAAAGNVAPTLLPMVVYMLGLMLPAIIVTVVAELISARVSGATALLSPQTTTS